MAGFFKQLTSFFTYKEPKNEELGFELLEGQNEGQDQNNENTRQASNESSNQKADQKQQNSKQQQNKTERQSNKQDEKNVSVKQPISVGQWNESRKAENTAKGNTCLSQNNTDDISSELCQNLATIKQKFHVPQNQDVIIREFNIGRKMKAFMVYLQGMMDKNSLDLAILPRLMSKDIFDDLSEEYPIDYLVDNILSVHGVKKSNKYSDAVMQVLNGISAMFVEGCSHCILIETRGFDKRSVEQPVTEKVVKGSQEGFTENLRTNVTLVRRIIKNEN